MTMPELTRDYR